MIRIIIIFTLVSVFSKMNAFAQTSSPSYEDFYEGKIERFKKMKNTGIGLTVFGVAGTIAGGIILSNVKWETSTDNFGNTTKTTTDGSAVGGFLLVMAGVPCAVTGVVLTIIGSNKVEHYKQKLSGLNMNVSFSQQHRGVGFTYNF